MRKCLSKTLVTDVCRCSRGSQNLYGNWAGTQKFIYIAIYMRQIKNIPRGT